MELDDLGGGEVPGGLLGKPHHQHRADREVRRVEDGDAGLAGLVVDVVGVPPTRADDARDARLDGTQDVRDDGARRGEVDHHVRVGLGCDELVSGI